MTLNTLTRNGNRNRNRPATHPFVAVAAETADWLAERLMTFELSGMSKPGSAERLRSQARSYRAHPELLEDAVA